MCLIHSVRIPSSWQRLAAGQGTMKMYHIPSPCLSFQL